MRRSTTWAAAATARRHARARAWRELGDPGRDAVAKLITATASAAGWAPETSRLCIRMATIARVNGFPDFAATWLDAAADWRRVAAVEAGEQVMGRIKTPTFDRG